MSALPDYAAALAQALRGVKPLPGVEQVALGLAGGRVLAEPVKADRDLPPFNRAQMDGYALRAAEFAQSPSKPWPVAATIPAGASADIRVPNGACVAIATGAPLPGDVDTVIQHELSDRGDSDGQPVRFKLTSVTAGQAVHARGSDAKAGDTLIHAGTVLGPQHLGIAAAVGKTTLTVARKPRAIVLTSGDEVVPAATALNDLKPQQIRNSNGPMMMEMLDRIGAMAAQIQHLPDQRDSTINAVGDAITNFDLIITIGGVSAGERDHFPAAFESCGVTTSLKGASIQPGRPIFVGRGPVGSVVIGLPGNPVSVLACACLFVWPIVRCMLGLDANLPWRDVKLAQAVKPNPQRRAFRPAIVQSDGRIVVPSWAGSGDLAHTAPTHGLVELPVQAEAVGADTALRFLPWP